MRNNNTDSELRALVEAFVADLSEVIRQAVLAVHEALGGALRLQFLVEAASLAGPLVDAADRPARRPRRRAAASGAPPRISASSLAPS